MGYVQFNIEIDSVIGFNSIGKYCNWVSQKSAPGKTDRTRVYSNNNTHNSRLTMRRCSQPIENSRRISRANLNIIAGTPVSRYLILMHLYNEPTGVVREPTDSFWFAIVNWLIVLYL